MTAYIQKTFSIKLTTRFIQLLRVETWEASKSASKTDYFLSLPQPPNVRQASFFNAVKPRIDYTFERHVRFSSGEVRVSNKFLSAILWVRFVNICQYNSFSFFMERKLVGASR